MKKIKQAFGIVLFVGLIFAYTQVERTGGQCKDGGPGCGGRMVQQQVN